MYPRILSAATVAALVFASAGTAFAAAVPVTGDVTCTTVVGALSAKPALGSGLLGPPVKVVKNFKEKLSITATLSNCTGTQSGTKLGLPVEGGSVKAKLNVPFLPLVCSGGPDSGTPCTLDSDCRGECNNGTNDGTPCTDNSVCTGGGTCKLVSCGDFYPTCGAIATTGFTLSGSSTIQPVAQIKWTNSDSGKPKPVAKSTVGSFAFSDAQTSPKLMVTLSGLVTKGAFLGQSVTMIPVLDQDIAGLLGTCTSCTCGGTPCDGPGPSVKGCDKGTGLSSASFAGFDNTLCTDVADPEACCTGAGTGTCAAASTP